jgi:hypothetical protein
LVCIFEFSSVELTLDCDCLDQAKVNFFLDGGRFDCWFCWFFAHGGSDKTTDMLRGQ